MADQRVIMTFVATKQDGLSRTEYDFEFVHVEGNYEIRWFQRIQGPNRPFRPLVGRLVITPDMLVSRALAHFLLFSISYREVDGTIGTLSIILHDLAQRMELLNNVNTAIANLVRNEAEETIERRFGEYERGYGTGRRVVGGGNLDRTQLATDTTRGYRFGGWILPRDGNRMRLGYMFPTTQEISADSWYTFFSASYQQGRDPHFRDNGSFPGNTDRYNMYELVLYEQMNPRVDDTRPLEVRQQFVRSGPNVEEKFEKQEFEDPKDNDY